MALLVMIQGERLASGVSVTEDCKHHAVTWSHYSTVLMSYRQSVPPPLMGQPALSLIDDVSSCPFVLVPTAGGVSCLLPPEPVHIFSLQWRRKSRAVGGKIKNKPRPLLKGKKRCTVTTVITTSQNPRLTFALLGDGVS